MANEEENNVRYDLGTFVVSVTRLKTQGRPVMVLFNAILNLIRYAIAARDFSFSADLHCKSICSHAHSNFTVVNTPPSTLVDRCYKSKSLYVFINKYYSLL